jgi:hypothetical protein
MLAVSFRVVVGKRLDFSVIMKNKGVRLGPSREERAR